MSRQSVADLEARLARVYGVQLATSPWLPGKDAEPEAWLRAAEQIGREIGARAPAPIAEHSWTALPVRLLAPPDPDARRAALERQLTWARAAGVQWDGVTFEIDAHGNASARAARSLMPGESLITVPRRMMIVDSEVSAAGLPPRDALAAWLALAVQDPASRWRAYLETLPVQLPELPMFHADLAALAGTTAFAIAAEDTQEIRTAYAELPAALRARLALADFAWGCAIVKSRGFHAPGSIEHRLAFVPIVDLMNHRLGDTTWVYDPLDGNFVVSTERAFAPGDEIHFSYGDRSNTRLLVHFGFIDPTNGATEGGLVFDRASDPVTAVAAHLLWNVPLDAPARVPVTCRLDHRFIRALSLARLHASSPADRERALELGLGFDGDMPWLDPAHEHRAIAVIAAAAQRGLRELDAATPRTPGDGDWDRSCATVRANEHAVLDQIVELTTALAAYLQTDPAGRRATADAIPGDATGAQRLLRQYLSVFDPS